MQSRLFTVALALLLWWTHATAADAVRPVVATAGSAAIEHIDEFGTAAHAATDGRVAPGDVHHPGGPAGADDQGASALDMPAMLMALPAVSHSIATMARPGPYAPAAWPAPHIGVPQRPPSATALVA